MEESVRRGILHYVPNDMAGAGWKPALRNRGGHTKGRPHVRGILRLRIAARIGNAPISAGNTSQRFARNNNAIRATKGLVHALVFRSAGFQPALAQSPSEISVAAVLQGGGTGRFCPRRAEARRLQNCSIGRRVRDKSAHIFSNSRRRLVCARLTGTSDCFLSFIFSM